MPKLDVRGQQSAAPGVQQIEAAYGGGMAAAQLKIADGLGKVAKAGGEAIDFFDMQQESEARVAAVDLDLAAEAELYRMETAVDDKGRLATKPEDREAEMTKWYAAQSKSVSENFRGSGARFWKQDSAQGSAKYELKARQSGRRTQLNETRANAIIEGEKLAAHAEQFGTVDAEKVQKYRDQLNLLVERGVLDADTAARLQIRTDSEIRTHVRQWEIADDAKSASRAWYESIIAGEGTEKEAMRALEDKLDPDTASVAKSFLARDLRLHAEEQRVARNEGLDAAYQYIYDNQGELPLELDLSGKDSIAVEAAAKRLREGKQTSDLGQSAGIYLEMADKHPDQFMKVDLWKLGLSGKISRSDFQFLRKAQDDMLAQREPTWESTPQWRATQLITEKSNEDNLNTPQERALARVRLQHVIEADERRQKQSDPSYVTTPERERELFDIFIMSKAARLIDYYVGFIDSNTPIEELTSEKMTLALDDTSGAEGTLRRQVYEQLLRDGEINRDANFDAPAVTDRIEELFDLVEEMRAY
jgi:hypothetical protein